MDKVASKRITSPEEEAENDPPCDDTEIVWRALFRSNWIDRKKQRATHLAYFRRTRASGFDKKGISVGRSNKLSIEGFKGKFKSPLEGIAAHKSSQIRSINDPIAKRFLDVRYDKDVHANIIRLPYKEDGDEEDARAHFLANQLAKQSTLVN